MINKDFVIKNFIINCPYIVEIRLAQNCDVFPKSENIRYCCFICLHWKITWIRWWFLHCWRVFLHIWCSMVSLLLLFLLFLFCFGACHNGVPNVHGACDQQFERFSIEILFDASCISIRLIFFFLFILYFIFWAWKYSLRNILIVCYAHITDNCVRLNYFRKLELNKSANKKGSKKKLFKYLSHTIFSPLPWLWQWFDP